MADQKTTRRSFLAAAAAGIAAPSLASLLSKEAQADPDFNIRAFPRPRFRTYFGPRPGQTGTLINLGNFTYIAPFHQPRTRQRFQRQFVNLPQRQIEERLCEMQQPFLTTGYVDDSPRDGLTTMNELRNLNENCYTAEGNLIFGIYGLPNGSTYNMHVRDSRRISVATSGIGTTKNRIPANQSFDLERTMKNFGPGNYTAEFEVNGEPFGSISFGLVAPSDGKIRGENNTLRRNQFDPKYPATFVSTGWSDLDNNGLAGIWEYDNPNASEYLSTQKLSGSISGTNEGSLPTEVFVLDDRLKSVRHWKFELNPKSSVAWDMGKFDEGKYFLSAFYGPEGTNRYNGMQEFNVFSPRERKDLAERDGVTIYGAGVQ